MDTWDIEATRKLICRQFGNKQLEFAKPCLSSVLDRRDYARFHYCEATKLFDAYIAEQLVDTSLLEVSLSSNDDTRAELHQLITEISAHVLACIQSLHAVADILAHAIYYSLGLNLSGKPIAEKFIDAHTLRNRLEQESDPKLLEVHRLFSELVSAGDFQYLQELVNYSKHRSIVRTGLHEDVAGKKSERYYLKLAGFSRISGVYFATDARPFLEGEIDRGSKLIIEIGNAVHSAL